MVICDAEPRDRSSVRSAGSRGHGVAGAAPGEEDRRDAGSTASWNRSGVCQSWIGRQDSKQAQGKARGGRISGQWDLVKGRKGWPLSHPPG